MFFPMIKKFIKWIFIIFTILVIVVFLFGKQIMIFLWHDLPFMGADFDKKKWDTAFQCNEKVDLECLNKELACLRSPMYRDLERHYLLQGTPKAKVIELLGEPQEALRHPECIDYNVGFCSGLKIDYDYIRVCFDTKDKIQSVFHYQS